MAGVRGLCLVRSEQERGHLGWKGTDEGSTTLATCSRKVDGEVGFVRCQSAGWNSGPPEEASGEADSVPLEEELTHKQSI